jgi:transposase
MWVAIQDLPRSAAHPFYTRLNQILDQHDFDGYVEALCQRFYAEEIGRPGLPPGRYFRLLLIGYFEGLDAERAIAWRAADSFALREFLGLVLPEVPPDHSTISRTRRLIDVETHEAVFTWILQRLADAGLLKGKTVGIDATTLEANAALRSIVRRDTGESYHDFLTKLAQASGIEAPTRADLARLDRKRKKKGSNDDWTHPHDPDAKITKMKDGRTHLAHKAEHEVDVETGAVVGVTVQDADAGDTTTSRETLIEAAEQIETVLPDRDGLQEVVGDKGYHSNDSLVDLEAVGVRSYISEPDRGRNWKEYPEARDAVYRNRRRIRGERGHTTDRGLESPSILCGAQPLLALPPSLHPPLITCAPPVDHNRELHLGHWVQIPRTSNPKACAARPRAVSWVAIVGRGPIRSRQISAVARWSASSVPSGIGIGSLARLSTGVRSRTRSIASSHSWTVRNRAAASSAVSEPCSRSRSIVRALSTAMSSLDTSPSYVRSSLRAPGSRKTMRNNADVSI